MGDGLTGGGFLSKLREVAQDPNIQGSVMDWAAKKDAEAAGPSSSPVDLASLQNLASKIAPMATAAAAAPKLVDLPTAQAFAILVDAGLSQEAAAANTGVTVPPRGGARKTKRRRNKKRKHGPRAKSQRVHRAAGDV